MAFHDIDRGTGPRRPTLMSASTTWPGAAIQFDPKEEITRESIQRSSSPGLPGCAVCGLSGRDLCLRPGFAVRQLQILVEGRGRVVGEGYGMQNSSGLTITILKEVPELPSWSWGRATALEGLNGLLKS